jgi:hypothetical protein
VGILRDQVMDTDASRAGFGGHRGITNRKEHHQYQADNQRREAVNKATPLVDVNLKLAPSGRANTWSS